MSPLLGVTGCPLATLCPPLVGGLPCPILGVISMDLITLDFTDATEARRGAAATLIGDSLDIDTVGTNAGTIGYEILTGLGQSALWIVVLLGAGVLLLRAAERKLVVQGG